MSIVGTVVDGRRLSGPQGRVLVVPNDLPAVRRARIWAPESSTVAWTNEQGRFRIRAFSSSGFVRIVVTASGFGRWSISQLRITRDWNLYVQLDDHPQSVRYTLPVAARDGFSEKPLPTPERSSAGCSGYFSNDLPPSTIKVYRVSIDTITTYDFNFYVKHVLPSEWLPSWEPDALKAGAMAVKNYGWHWVNNWRGGTAHSECYDVNDTTQYQVFNPSYSTSQTDAAVDATWNWLARVAGAIFETQYRAGSNGMTCGEEATGARMYQWGTQACALLGEQWQQIFATYYYPGVVFTEIQSTYAFSVSGPSFYADPGRTRSVKNVVPAQVAYASWTFTNTGDVTWRSDDVQLGTRNGAASAFASPAWPSSSRAWTLDGDVPPNASVTAAITITGSIKPAAYSEAWGLYVKSQSKWMSGSTSLTLTVRSATQQTTASFAGVADPEHRIADFNGDGLDDVFMYAPGGTSRLMLSTPTGPVSSVLDYSTGTGYKPLVGDFSGDGQADLFWYAPGITADRIWFFNSDGTIRNNLAQTQLSNDYIPLVGDFAGDEADDVFWYSPNSHSDSMYLGDPSGHMTQVPEPARDFGYRPIVGDFSGDGKDDIFWYGPGAVTDRIWFFDPNGTIHNDLQQIQLEGDYLPFSGDFTGDGKEDVIFYSQDSHTDSIFLGAASGHLTQVVLPARASGSQPQVGDFNGDARADVWWYVPGSADDPIWTFHDNGTVDLMASETMNNTYQPVPGDFNGDSRTDLVLYQAGSGNDYFSTFDTDLVQTSSLLPSINGTYLPVLQNRV